MAAALGKNGPLFVKNEIDLVPSIPWVNGTTNQGPNIGSVLRSEWSVVF